MICMPLVLLLFYRNFFFTMIIFDACNCKPSLVEELSGLPWYRRYTKVIHGKKGPVSRYSTQYIRIHLLPIITMHDCCGASGLAVK